MVLFVKMVAQDATKEKEKGDSKATTLSDADRKKLEKENELVFYSLNIEMCVPSFLCG